MYLLNHQLGFPGHQITIKSLWGKELQQCRDNGRGFVHTRNTRQIVGIYLHLKKPSTDGIKIGTARFEEGKHSNTPKVMHRPTPFLPLDINIRPLSTYFSDPFSGWRKITRTYTKNWFTEWSNITAVDGIVNISKHGLTGIWKSHLLLSTVLAMVASMLLPVV